MKRLNKAFTLTELLVALGVIAILCAILLPVIFNMMPNQNTIMAKRAYYTTQSVVADLINDEACYPDKTSASVLTEKRVGFDDAAGSANCLQWDETHLDDNTAAQAATKFITLFSDKLGQTATLDSPFASDDSMQWVFSDAAFTSPTTASPTATQKVGGSIKLTVDVNGDGAPNCGTGTTYSGFSQNGTDCATRTNGFDRFQMTINGNGKIQINPADVWAINAVKVDRNITGDHVSNETDN